LDPIKPETIHIHNETVQITVVAKTDFVRLLE
jgi:hypothetical protein